MDKNIKKNKVSQEGKIGGKKQKKCKENGRKF